MNIVICNKVFGIYEPNVVVKQIVSSTHVTTVTSQGLASTYVKDIDTRLYGKIKNGSIMVAARNLSCNSSREWAPRVPKFSGVELVIIDSSARIFFRSAINTRLPIIECADICGFCRMRDELEVDLSKGIIRSITQGTETKGVMFPGSLLDTTMAGGLLGKLKAEMEGK